MSHAMCVRGLKHEATGIWIERNSVARHVRAWIETLKFKEEELKYLGRTPCACVD